MKSLRKSSYLIRITIDILLLLVNYLLIIIISPSGYVIESITGIFLLLLSLLIVWFYTSKAVGLYNEFRSTNFSFELISILKCVTSLSLTIIVLQFIFVEIRLSRMFVVYFSFSFLFSLIVEKYLARLILGIMRKRGRNLRSLLIIGAGEVGENFYKSIKENAHFGYFFLGFLDDSKKELLNGQYLGKIDCLESILEKNIVDDIIIALPNYAENKIEDIINICEKHPTRVKIIPDYFKFVTGSKYNVTMFDRFPIISIREDKISELQWTLLKRTFDILFSFSLTLLFLSWLYPLIAILIKISSKGPVLFKQERWGRSNKKFYVYKFRTMVWPSSDIDDKGKYLHALKKDPRITWIGSFLRKSNLDELPQFWNVIKGDMSIVGPRPHPTPLNLESKINIRKYLLRHLVKPGITGWAQIHGLRGNAMNKDVMQRRVYYDIWYIENWSFLLDIKIIILTVLSIFRGEKNAY